MGCRSTSRTVPRASMGASRSPVIRTASRSWVSSSRMSQGSRERSSSRSTPARIAIRNPFSERFEMRPITSTRRIPSGRKVAFTFSEVSRKILASLRRSPESRRLGSRRVKRVRRSLW